MSSHNAVQASALPFPILNKLINKRLVPLYPLFMPWGESPDLLLPLLRVVLASASPRRKEILASIVRPPPPLLLPSGPSKLTRSLTRMEQGLEPEIVPSSFAEDLPHASYAHDLTEYPIATAGEKVCPPLPLPSLLSLSSRALVEADALLVCLWWG